MASNPTRTFVTGEVAPHRPRVARETRRLLMTAALAVLTLWVLARIRFPDRPVTPNPVPPLLSQLTGVPRFSDLASAIDDVRGRLGPSLMALMPIGAGDATSASNRTDRVPALRIRDDLAVAILDPRLRVDGSPLDVVIEDRASGLAVIRVELQSRIALPAVWNPQRLEKPRYVIASSPSSDDVSLRPAFIGSLTAVPTPRWIGPVWALPKDADVAAGAFLFTDDAELIGVVTPYENGLAVVPGSLLLIAAEDLLRQPQKVPAELGVEVQTLTPRLSAASGAETGIVVAWVDPRSSAASVLRVGDVIQSVDGIEMLTPDHWRVRMARLGTGETIALHVVRRGVAREVHLMAAAPNGQGSVAPLGLTMRPIARVGAEVVRVDRGSAADVAGIQAGDVITSIAERGAPTTAQVQSAFAAAGRGDLVIVSVRRGTEHRVMALQR